MTDVQDEDSAERAFNALREEVAALRQGLEWKQGPDYAPTLGAIASEMERVGTRLEAIERMPASELRHTLRAQGEETRKILEQHARRLDEAARAVHFVVGAANTQVRQQRREWAAVAIGAVLGLVAWYPLAFLTPFGGGHWLVASLIGGGQWQAGQALMQEADPATWNRMVRLYKACPIGTAPDVCEAAMTAKPATPETAKAGAPAKAGAKT